jgi:hypothetical protein
VGSGFPDWLDSCSASIFAGGFSEALDAVGTNRQIVAEVGDTSRLETS